MNEQNIAQQTLLRNEAYTHLTTNFVYTPSVYAEKHLLVADCLGYVASPSFRYDRQTFDSNLVMIVLCGTIYVEQYGKKITLTAGQGILMSLKDRHLYYSDKKDIGHIIFTHFKGTPVIPIMETLKAECQLPIIFNDSSISQSILDCFEIVSNLTDTFEYELSTVLYQMILKISQSILYEIQQQEILRTRTAFSVEMEDYIAHNIMEPITLDHLYQHMNMSKYHFCRVFQTTFHTSPMEYIRTQRLKIAKRLLAETPMKIDEIAQLLFFSDQSHFSKIFKKKVGITPIDYRRTHKYTKITLQESLR